MRRPRRKDLSAVLQRNLDQADGTGPDWVAGMAAAIAEQDAAAEEGAVAELRNFIDEAERALAVMNDDTEPIPVRRHR